jgi:hypothetical protein
MPSSPSLVLLVLLGGVGPSAVAQELVWSYPHTTDLRPLTKLSDLDRDGSVEILFNDSVTGRFSAIDMASKTTRFQASSWAWAADVLDFDGDGIEDVLAGTAANRFDVFAGDDFRVLHSFTVSGVQASLPFLIPDVTGDGLADLGVVADNYGVAVYASEDDHQLWKILCGYQWPFVMGDLDGDGHVELFSRSPACNAKVAAVSAADGHLVLEYAEAAQGLPWSDEDGDGIADLYFHVSKSYVIRSAATGALLRSVPHHDELFAVHPLGDVDGDGLQELVGTDSLLATFSIVSGWDLSTILYEWTALVGPGQILELQGDRDFDRDGRDDFLFGYRFGTTAETQIRSGNDLWLRARLNVDPASGARDAVLGLGLGSASGRGVLALVGVNGVPTFQVFWIDSFGADLAFELSGSVPPALFGTQLELWGFGIGRSGRLETTAVVPMGL